MLKTIIVLPDGAEISSGSGMANAVKTCTITECVNSGEELTLGSTCACALEATLLTPFGGLTIEAGAEVTVYKEDAVGDRTQVGIFVLEKPTRPTANTMKLTGYDRVSKLDKDLTEWLSGLTGWPYKLTDFAGMVCSACGLTFKAAVVPNGDFQVHQFTRSSATGRQLMQWLGEICCSFCRATADGSITFGWYAPSGVTITATGDPYYFQNGLSYEDYQTEAINAVQVRLADSENGALWPSVEPGTNSYIITGNPILNSRITAELDPVLDKIKDSLLGVRYRPCKVLMPVTQNISVGSTVDIVDKNGVEFTAYVMTKTQKGQQITLECTGSRRRDSSSAINNQDSAASAEKALDNLTMQQIFNKLTNDGQVQGIYAQDGKWFINAELAQIVNLIADIITAGTLKSKDGTTYFDLDNAEFVSNNPGGRVVIKEGEFRTYSPDGAIAFSVAKSNVPHYSYMLSLFDPGNGSVFQIGARNGSPVIFVPTADTGTRAGYEVVWRRNSDGHYYLSSL